jgi:hypothetical protein
MAKEVGLTPDAVMRIWHAFWLQPHRQETWKLSKDPQFIEKVHDICGLYLNPPERAVVLAVDEKAQIQALDPSDTQPPGERSWTHLYATMKLTERRAQPTTSTAQRAHTLTIRLAPTHVQSTCVH